MPTYRRSVVPSRPGSAALPLVAIVGRPNVGKSTLFNRLTGSRRSIVGDEPGITRDRIYGEYEWEGRHFRLVDTGGIVPDDPELIPTEIYNQAKVALDEAAALVMVVDARTELARPDYDLVRLLAARQEAGVSRGEQGRGRGDGAGGGELSPAGHSRGVSDQLGAWAGHRRSAGCDCRAICASAGDRNAKKSWPKRTRSSRADRWSRAAEGAMQPENIRQARSFIAPMASSSSTRPRWRSSGGPTWASRRC